MKKERVPLLSSIVFLCLLCWVPLCWAGSAMLPCVENQTISLATSNLSAAGFQTLLESQVFSETVGVGKVAVESPSCGFLVDTLTPVSLSVSVGSLAAAGASLFGTAVDGILWAFGLGIFFGLFVKLTNRS